MLAVVLQYAQGRTWKKPTPMKEFIPKFPDWRERAKVVTDPLQRSEYAALKAKVESVQRHKS